MQLLEDLVDFLFVGAGNVPHILVIEVILNVFLFFLCKLQIWLLWFVLLKVICIDKILVTALFFDILILL